MERTVLKISKNLAGYTSENHYVGHVQADC